MTDRCPSYASSTSARRRSTWPRCSPPSTTTPPAGSTLFVGRVRDHDHGQGVDRAGVLRAPDAARRGCARSASASPSEYDVLGVAAVHRVGTLAIGDIAVVVPPPPPTGARRSTPPGRSSTSSRPRCRSGSTSCSATAPTSGSARPRPCEHGRRAPSLALGAVAYPDPWRSCSGWCPPVVVTVLAMAVGALAGPRAAAARSTATRRTSGSPRRHAQGAPAAARRARPPPRPRPQHRHRRTPVARVPRTAHGAELLTDDQRSPEPAADRSLSQVRGLAA